MKQLPEILTLVFLFLSQASWADKAIFAGGCFWCVEADFEKLEGVTGVVSGYTGGTLENPTYQQVLEGGTGHYEAVEIEFDPAKVSYRQLLDFYWRNIDPFNSRGQFCDTGDSYRPAIFPLDAKQEAVAKELLASQQKNLPGDQAIAVKVIPASTFYPAETSHQDYHKNNRLRYETYRWRCGRDARLQEIWGKTEL